MIMLMMLVCGGGAYLSIVLWRSRLGVIVCDTILVIFTIVWVADGGDQDYFLWVTPIVLVSLIMIIKKPQKRKPPDQTAKQQP